MKSIDIIRKYPIIAILSLGAAVYFMWRIMLSLFVATAIVLPLYLAVQIINDKK
tara:strand:- start:502 stop:663 length:162 start_codon:yes stop_codon:yes gene_type:complete